MNTEQARILTPEATPFDEVEALPERTPEELFAEHVALVREQGDVLDARAHLWVKRVGKIAATGAMAAGALWYRHEPSAVPLVAGACVAALGGSWAVWRKSRDFDQAWSRAGSEAQLALNAEYDLYRRGRRKKEIALHWQGPEYEAEDVPDALTQLERIADLAQKNGVDTLILGRGLTTSYFEELELPGKTMTVSRWLEQSKSLTVGGLARKQLWQVASPEEWLQAVGQLRTEQNMSTIDSLVNLLAKEYPRHPLVRIYQEFSRPTASLEQKQGQKLLRQRLSEQLRAGFARELPETESVLQNRHTAPVRLRQYKEARIEGMKVHYYVNGKYDSTVALETALGMDQARVEQLVSRPARDMEAVRAIEFSLYKMITAQEAVEQKVDGREQIKLLPALHYSPQHVLGLDQALPAYYKKRYSLAGTRLWKGLAATIFAVSGLVGAGITTVSIDMAYEEVLKTAKAQIAAEQGLEPERAHIDQALVQQRADEWSVINQVWGDWVDLRATFAKPGTWGDVTESERPAETPKYSQESGGYGSAVGNVSAAPDRPAWTLTPVNMEASGYWAMNTSAMLVGVPPQDNIKPVGPHMQWVLNDYSRRSGPVDGLPVSSEAIEQQPGAQIIRVERELHSADTIKNPGYGSVEWFTPIPVLEGTEVVSINLDGKPVSLMRAADGTYAIERSGGAAAPTGKLQYWLSPALHKEDARPKATELTKIAGEMDYDLSAQLEQWSRVVPGFTEMDDKRRRQAIIEYMQEQFTYSERPFPVDALAKTDSWAEFTQLLFEYEQANCNIANTALALVDNDLNAVVGFYNKDNDGKTMLSTKEMHQWMVNRGGGRFDATPSRAAVVETTPPGRSPLTPWLLGLGVVTAAGVGFVSRRKAMRLARWGTQAPGVYLADRAERRLLATHPTVLRFVAAAAEQSIYAPALNLAEVRSRAASSTFTDEQALEKLLRTDIHDKHVEERLRRHPSLPRDVADTLSLARRVAAHR